jgi:hypothetical protein
MARWLKRVTAVLYDQIVCRHRYDTVYGRVFQTDGVLNNGEYQQHVLLCKCCYHQAAFRSTSEMGDENVIIFLIIVICIMDEK